MRRALSRSSWVAGSAAALLLAPAVQAEISDQPLFACYAPTGPQSGRVRLVPADGVSGCGPEETRAELAAGGLT